jgi:anaerobic ribonucleoside-triphosphate reductase activating protein
MRLKIASIIKESIVDGPGLRYVIFTQGCKHSCYKCHNTLTHSFDEGTYKNIEEILKEINENPLLDGVTFSGGDPLEQLEVISVLIPEIKKNNNKLNIIIYTGYLIEDILYNNKFNCIDINRLLEYTDYIIDGKFDYKLKSLELKFKGSSNQRIIDILETLKQKKIIEKEF